MPCACGVECCCGRTRDVHVSGTLLIHMLGSPSQIPFCPSTPSSVWSDSDASSMASSSVTGGLPPPLTRGNSTISSEDAAETDEASSIMGEGYLLQEREGVLTVPDRYQPEATLPCPFQILDCEKMFPDVYTFKTHVFSHFGGKRLPTSAACFLCDRKFTQDEKDDVALSWNQMLSHMVYEHYRQGEQLAVVRPDFALMRWMFSRHLINDHQLKRAQLVPAPMLGLAGEIINAPHAPMPPQTSLSMHQNAIAQMRRSMGSRNEPYTMNAGLRADRRQRDSTRHMIRS